MTDREKLRQEIIFTRSKICSRQKTDDENLELARKCSALKKELRSLDKEFYKLRAALA